MKANLLLCFLIATLSLSCAIKNTKSMTDVQLPAARFSQFNYSGDDELFKKTLAADEYQNPLLAGFHPDPSIVRVGEDYYLVNSTFGFFPGIPVFHSRDLVNWVQVGNAITRADQMVFDGLPLSGAGIYAPAIEYRDGVFYIVSTCVGCGGNFVVTTADPAGPWSKPIWMPHLQGIDPSIFFEGDKAYVVHHRDPDSSKKKYPAHTALWIKEVDPVTFEAISEDVMLVDGGVKMPWNTDYIEGPHIYKVKGVYYLSAPGGGTGYYHQQLIYRSDNIFGPYQANPNNPILTQFGLPDDRDSPVTATGHADLIQDSNGDWWAVFLGTRVYDLSVPPQDPGNFHTGRETFMLPVTWRNGWPVILDQGIALDYTPKRPRLPVSKTALPAMTGNFRVKEAFDQSVLAAHWLFIRTPHSKWWDVGNGELVLQLREDQIGQNKQPSFIGRRLAHMTASFGARLKFTPANTADEAGLLAVQNDEHYYAFGLGLNKEGKPVLRIRKRAGIAEPAIGVTLVETSVNIRPQAELHLQIHIDKSAIHFAYSLDGERFEYLLESADSRLLTSAVANGFTGAVVGMYAQGAH